MLNQIKNKLGIGVFIALVLCLFMLLGIAPAMADQEGNIYYSAQPPLATAALGTDGAGYYSRGVAFPSDDNAQMKILFIDATGNTASDTVDIYAYIRNGNTIYKTTTLAFCGGNTNYLHADNQIQSDGNTTSGNSYFVIDDGAGNCGWGAFLDKAGAGTGDIIEIHTGCSNLSQGPAGFADLSGVTFPKGSRVYPMTQIGSFVAGNGNSTVDSNSAIFAAPKGSPIMAINQDATTGVTIHGITAERVGLR